MINCSTVVLILCLISVLRISFPLEGLNDSIYMFIKTAFLWMPLVFTMLITIAFRAFKSDRSVNILHFSVLQALSPHFEMLTYFWTEIYFSLNKVRWVKTGRVARHTSSWFGWSYSNFQGMLSISYFGLPCFAWLVSKFWHS